MQERSLLRRYYCGEKYKLDSVDPEVKILSMIENFPVRWRQHAVEFVLASWFTK